MGCLRNVHKSGKKANGSLEHSLKGLRKQGICLNMKGKQEHP